MAFVTQLLDGGHHIGAEFHQIPGPVSLRCVKWGGTKQREHMFVIYIIYINSAPFAPNGNSRIFSFSI